MKDIRFREEFNTQYFQREKYPGLVCSVGL
jgi:hypothetical protein